MQGPTRREFLGSMAGFALLPLDQEKPELILHNANIWTVNAAAPRAQAVAIARGRFLAVGSDSEVLNLAGAGVRREILTGKPCCPDLLMRTRILRRPGDCICGWWTAICGR